MTNLDRELQEAHEQLAKLEAEQKAFNALTREQRLATMLHEGLCSENHTDGCSWYYHTGIEAWSYVYEKYEVHQRYLRMAQRLLDIGLTEDQIKDSVAAVKGEM